MYLQGVQEIKNSVWIIRKVLDAGLDRFTKVFGSDVRVRRLSL